MAFKKARDRLRSEKNDNTAANPIYKQQAAYMAEFLKKEPGFLKDHTDKIIYRGWEPLFKKIKLFPHVKETLDLIRQKGMKLGLLSDFPPATKLDYLGLGGFWDTVLCSEEIGRLKPDPLPFLKLAEKLSFPPEEILYVGNSYAYDVMGAAKTGMKTAWIISRRKFLFGSQAQRNADFVFHDYRQLQNFMIT